MKFRLNSLSVWLVVVVFLSGCTQLLTVDTQPIATAILLTSTPFPTTSNIPATFTPLPSPIFTSTPSATPKGSAQDITVIFIGETIPDGTNFQPGQAFQKTWTIKNGGIEDWNKNFELVSTSSNPVNESLGSPEHIPLTQDVKPGETIQIKVDLVAPKQDGQYTVFYELRDGTGTLVPNSQKWVTITDGNIPVSNSMGVNAQLLTAYMENSEFTVDFCMQLPDGRQWYPWNVLLLVNQQDYSPSGSRIDPVGATTSNKCFSFSFPVWITSGTTYQLSIGKVELPPEVHQAENCAYAQTTLRASYPGLDFKCAGPGAWYTNLVLPSGMTKEQADQLILDAMSSSIYGPWTLSGITS